MKRFLGRCSKIVYATAAAAALLAGVILFGTHDALSAQPPPLATSPDAADAVARGKKIYDARCVECHGPSGKGDGPAAPLLTPRPRDFSTGKFKIRTTETGSVPTEADLVQSVRQGLYGTAMPAWGTLLSDAEIHDVVTYLETLSPRFAAGAPADVTPGPQVPSSPESIVRGRQVYDKLQCSKCHGTDGRGNGAVATDFRDDWDQPLHAADLSQPWTFHGGATARDVYLRFRTGMSGTPMPSFRESASDAEMWDLANYVVSLGRKPVWSMTADEVAARYAQERADAKADPVKRGKYIVDTSLCALCHSPVDEHDRILPGMTMAGGQLIRVLPFGDFPTGNLTSDKATGLGNWTDDQIKQAVTKGVLPDGSRMLPFPMDWAAFSALAPDDLNAMIAYLRTIPPVSNRVPARSRPFLPLYLWGKFKMLILKIDGPILIYSGNVGARGGR